MLQVLNYITNLCYRSLTTINLIGRYYLKPKDFTATETKSILWTAFDIKKLFKEGQKVRNIKSSRVTLLMHKPVMEVQASAMSAANLMKLHLNVIIDPDWDIQEFVNDNARFLSTCCDMIFCQSQYHSKLIKFAEGSTIPIVAVRSCSFTNLNVLADIMALQEKYGHLKNLRIGWIGGPCPLLNAFLCIAPQFGINIQYYCACKYSGKGMSPAVLPLGKELSKKNQTELHECDKVETAIDKVDAIVVAKHDLEEIQVNLKCIKEKAHENWSVLHQMPRSHVEIAPEVFDHENSLVWEAKGNLQYIYAAFMLRLLSNYQHVNKQPKFE